MRPLCLLLLLVVQVTAGEEEKLTIYKCCDVFQMLSGDGLSCVDARWPRNVTLDLWFFGLVTPPHDARWVNRWLPPGLSLDRVGMVVFDWRRYGYIFKRPFVRAVNSSAEWDERQGEAEGAAYRRNDRLWIRTGGVMRRGFYNYRDIHTVLDPKHYGSASRYCVDAARPPRAPFVLLVQPNCDAHDCISKCCEPGQVMANHSGSWKCEKDAGGNWSPETSSFARYLHPETPFDDKGVWNIPLLSCASPGSLLLAPFDAKKAELIRRSSHSFLFSSWDSCTDFQRLENGTLAETLFYCQKSQISRGVYWLLRPLCLVSTSLLVMALLSIASNSSMRRKVHGWCLSCHATCLLGFNLGQVAYYMSLSDVMDTFGYTPEYFSSACFKFALAMYFLLNAANCWLTALCLNMVLGFRKLQVTRPGGGGDRKKFLVLSVVAWGLPALMTGVCAYAFDTHVETRKWYSPTLVETRTCFNELIGATIYSDKNREIMNVHRYPGTAIFYYGPTGALIVVNAICIGFTLRKVQFLRQGNSILHREGTRRQRRQEEENPQAATTSVSNEAHTTTVDAKTIKLYMKMLLMVGAVEMMAECIVWATIHNGQKSGYDIYYTFAYRASGYATDCFRAACVSWLSSPEGGYWGALRRRLGGGERERGRGGGGSR